MHEHIRSHAREERVDRFELRPWEEVLIDLMRTPSVTGQEREVALLLEQHLKNNFPEAQVFRQHISDGRWNVIMEQGTPRLTLTSHLDVVPGGPP